MGGGIIAYSLVFFGGGAGGGGFHNTAGSKSNGWSAGRTGSSFDNALNHYNKHGYDVGAKSFDDYLRKADAFKETVFSKGIKGVLVTGYAADVYRYKYSNKYIDLQKQADGTYKIVSYGKQ
jgi:hypothetical protein